MLSMCCRVVRSATLTPCLLDATNRKRGDPHNDYRNENQPSKCWLAHLFPFLLLVYCYTYRTTRCLRCRSVRGRNPKRDNQNIPKMRFSFRASRFKCPYCFICLRFPLLKQTVIFAGSLPCHSRSGYGIKLAVKM